jgi:hypothetical protein
VLPYVQARHASVSACQQMCAETSKETVQQHMEDVAPAAAGGPRHVSCCAIQQMSLCRRSMLRFHHGMATRCRCHTSLLPQ